VATSDGGTMKIEYGCGNLSPTTDPLRTGVPSVPLRPLLLLTGTASVFRMRMGVARNGKK